MVRILRAQSINRLLGGALVAPWEVDSLPDEFLDAVDGLTRQLPEYTAARKKMTARREAWLKSHPNYRQ